jgi:hypothetical protein
MAHAAQSGPCIEYGDVVVNGTIAGFNPDAGPALVFQGDSLWDVRQNTNLGSNGPFYGLVQNAFFDIIDAAPQAASNTAIAAAQTATYGTALTLATPSYGIGRFIMQNPGRGYSQASPPAVTITGGGGTGATAYALVANGQVYAVNVLNAGSGYSTMPTVTIAAPPGSNGITATAEAVTAITVMTTVSNYINGTAINATSLCIDIGAGYLQPRRAGRYFDPTTSIARCLTITSNNAADTNLVALATGWDVWGQPMTEAIQVSANATATGNKAFAQVGSVTVYKRPTTVSVVTATAANGVIASTAVTTAGTPYNATPYAFLSGGGGSGAVLRLNYTTGGGVTSATILNAGGGYTSNPTVTVLGGGTGGTTTGTISVGTSDNIGFPLLVTDVPYLSIFYNRSFQSSLSSSVVAPDYTSPGYATSGDPRGTFTLPSASDGTKRLVVSMFMPNLNQLYATGDNTWWLFGPTSG